MGLIRLITYALLIWIVWNLIKNYLAKQRLHKSKAKPADKLSSQKVVKCLYCDLHLPEAEAISSSDGTFCSQAHKQAWLEHKP